MRFGILTQYYPPEVGAPQARLSGLAEGLVQRGHEVYVLTAMPNYPGGKIYPGYGGWLRREMIRGVHVVRVAIYPCSNLDFLPRLASCLSFMVTSILIGGWRLPGLDYLLTESPPLFLGLCGYLLSRWKRARWIFNVSDLWPESALRLGYLKRGVLTEFASALERFCYQKAWMVSGQSKDIIQNITLRYPRVHTYHYSNGVDIKAFSPSRHPGADRSLGSKDEVIVLYAGLHGLAQGLDQVLLVAQRLRGIQKLKFILIGDGPQKSALKQMVRELGLAHVQMMEAVAKEQLPDLIRSADICLISMKTYIPGAVPSKLYAAMGCGKPVLLIGEGEAAAIVKACGSGLVVAPGDIQGIDDSLRFLIQHPELWEVMGRGGRLAVEQYFDREKIIEKFEKFLVSAR